jgi:hypothetical protein
MVFLTPPTNLSAVSLTPAINLRHGFSLKGSVVDTGDKFITGVVDTAEKLSPVATTPMINFCRYQQHRRTIITGDNSTGDKFIASIINTGEQ